METVNLTEIFPVQFYELKLINFAHCANKLYPLDNAHTFKKTEVMYDMYLIFDYAKPAEACL